MPPRNARNTPRNQRFYDWKGDRFWSVTAITKGGLPESYGLSRWKRNVVAKGAVEAVQRGILVPMVEDNPEGSIEYLAELPYSRSAKARDLGTSVHTAIEGLVLGTPAPEPGPDEVPYLEQFAAFREAYAPEFLAAETTVYHRTHSYAGTLDAVVVIDGRSYVLDVKTGGGVYPEVALQLAAYRAAEFMGLPNGAEEPMIPTETEGLCLHLQPTWWELHRVDAGERILNTFLYARETFRWDVVTSKEVMRGRLPRPNADGSDDAAFTPEAVAMFEADPGPEVG